MQLIFLPKGVMIASFFAGWLVFQVGAALIASRIPGRFLRDGAFWRPFGFETERFYRIVFGIRRWKGALPDGAALFKSGFRKKQLRGAESEYIEAFREETRRAELVHWLAIAPFWVFGLWAPPVVIPLMLAYALAVNLPCILAQRYNRPRLQRLLKRLDDTARQELLNHRETALAASAAGAEEEPK